MFKKKFSDDEIRIKAHELWEAREGKGKTSVDDWNEAIEALKTERSLIKRFFEWTGFKEKKGWDFLQLLIVPAVLSVGALYLQDAAKQRDTKAADEKAKQDTLIKYFDQMADLLLKEKLLQNLRNPDSEIFIIGRSKTVSVLQSLDPNRQYLVIQFLKSANLNGVGESSSIQVFEMLYLKGFLKKGLLYKAKMSNTQLHRAALNEAYLVEADLIGSDLREAHLVKSNLSNANLSFADLRKANLRKANFSNADLSNADLREADLVSADLRGVDLREADLRESQLVFADLRGANIRLADLREADLGFADLRGADLGFANLRGVNLRGANLIGADLRDVKQLRIEQIEDSCYWENAKFSDDFRKQLDQSISQKVNPKCKPAWNGN
jgi:uncharacterized protein YjbI with pentapeptide repeats